MRKMGIGVKTIKTPEGITGRLGPCHRMEEKHPLQAKALAVQACGQTHLLLTCDLTGHTKSTMARLHRAIEKATGVVKTRVVLTCTHTHCGPWIWDRQALFAQRYGIMTMDWDWYEQMIVCCVHACNQAIADMEPVEVYTGQSIVSHIASNRLTKGGRFRGSVCDNETLRNRKVGLIDPYVHVITIADRRDRIKAVIANYACHPSAYGGGKTIGLSPDFPYFAQLRIQQKYGAHVPLFYWQGCAGDVNPGKFNAKGDDETVSAMGNRLAEAVFASIEHKTDTKWNTCKIDFLSNTFYCELGHWIKERKATKTAFKDSCTDVAKTLHENKCPDDATVAKWRSAAKAWDSGEAADGNRLPARVDIWRFGSVQWIFLPGEWFVWYGLNLQSFATAKTYCTTLSDFDLRYIPDPEAILKKEGYGTQSRSRTISDESVHTLYECIKNMV